MLNQGEIEEADISKSKAQSGIACSENRKVNYPAILFLSFSSLDIHVPAYIEINCSRIGIYIYVFRRHTEKRWMLTFE